MKPGIYTIPAGEYHGDPGERPSLSSSIAKILVAQSPAHARAAHPRLNPNWEPDHDEKFDIGTVVHGLLLQEGAEVEVCDFDDWRTSAAKEQRDAARAAGKTPLLTKHWEQADRIAVAVREQLEWLEVDVPLLRDGAAEQTVVWEEYGTVLCRARLDWLRSDLVAIDDLKTTSRSANPEQFSRSLFDLGYDVQAAFYRRGVRAVTGVDPDFRFLVVETSAPYALSVVSLGEDALALANKKVEWALDKWARCLRDDVWPAYPTSVQVAELPGWVESRWLAREMAEVA